ncbi:MAG: nickel-type superoxide dismutase maturation protease [Myxococcota bacterium]|nr:nickel-type superoxide dismutase maturation protease [Myxococcota bacterium]
MTFGEFFQWLIQRRRRFKVGGDSMLPTLAPDDHVLVDPSAYGTAMPSSGDIVIARHPYQAVFVIKRIGRVEDSAVELVGDNPRSSTDSRIYGLIPVERVLGRVTSRI